jgi:hypothetical protein
LETNRRHYRGAITSDLGVSREWIRSETLKFVKQTVETRLDRFFADGELQKLLHQVIEQRFNDRPPMAGLSLRATIEKAVYDMAKDFVKANVELTVKEKSHSK